MSDAEGGYNAPLPPAVALYSKRTIHTLTKDQLPMDLYDDIRQHVLKELPHRPEDHAELEAKRVDELLILYLNWRSRYVTPRPRKVHRSKALDANALATDPTYQPGIERITYLIETGGDLGPHLSRGVKYGYEGSGPLREAHLDPMLNDWGVHHLHMNIEMDTDGFVKRPRTEPQWNYLLFAAFRPDDAYLIDIMEHGDWVRDHVMQVVMDEWPDAGILMHFPGITLGNIPTEEERAKLRKAGLITGYNSPTGAFLPASLLSSAGTSMKRTGEADEILKRVRWFMELAEKPEEMVQVLAAQGYTLPPDPDLHFVYSDDDGAYGIVDAKTGYSIRLG